MPRPFPMSPTPGRLVLAGGLLLLAFVGMLRTARADPILFEVCYDGDGTDADDVFTEIYGSAGFSLDGWSLQGVNGSDGTVYRTVSLDGLSIPTDGLLVLATSSATGSVLSARDATADVDWQNGPDAVWLVDADGNVADALQYGDAGTYNAGEGTYAADVSAGWSLTRDLWATDTDDNATDWSALSAPTPGVGPSFSAVPEPSSCVLLATGTLALAVGRRRRRIRRCGDARLGPSAPPGRRAAPVLPVTPAPGGRVR